MTRLDLLEELDIKMGTENAVPPPNKEQIKTVHILYFNRQTCFNVVMDECIGVLA